jgi:hypothetical protein
MADEIKPDESTDESVDTLLDEIVDFIDFNTFNKIINKLTDYAEILSEGKIAGIINFNFRLNSNQTNRVVKLLEETQGITRIYNLALKGSKDLEVEYLSMIFSDYENPEATSAYINIKNIIENRLTHQVQQYNINMGKNNTTMSIPLNELRGHVKTFLDLSEMKLAISTKAQHGIIAASLHDAYTTLLNKSEFYNDKTYMKFFFNEDDPTRKKIMLLRRERRMSIREIGNEVKTTLERLRTIMYNRMQNTRDMNQSEPAHIPDFSARNLRSETFIDRMMMTPFGKQYGGIIDRIITAIFDPAKRDLMHDISEESIKEKTVLLFQTFKLKSDMSRLAGEALHVVDYLLMQDYGIKTFAEKFLYFDRKETFTKFFSGQNQEQIEQFLSQVFAVYFEESFSSLFRIIKSMDMKKFACAFIIKRIYLKEGENLSNFGYFFIRAIAKIGGIKAQ